MFNSKKASGKNRMKQRKYTEHFRLWIGKKFFSLAERDFCFWKQSKFESLGFWGAKKDGKIFQKKFTLQIAQILSSSSYDHFEAFLKVIKAQKSFKDDVQDSREEKSNNTWTYNHWEPKKALEKLLQRRKLSKITTLQRNSRKSSRNFSEWQRITEFLKIKGKFSKKT